MNILEHFNKLSSLKKENSVRGNHCMMKKFEASLMSEKSTLLWIDTNVKHLNECYGKEQKTLLQRAIQLKNEFAVDTLLQAGASPDISDLLGLTEQAKNSFRSIYQ